MRHDNATNFQRFMAFFIDFMLLSIVSGLILSFIPEIGRASCRERV